MIAILTAVTLFVAIIVALNRVPEHMMTSDIWLVRCYVGRDNLTLTFACALFLFEWHANGRDYDRDGTVSGMRLLTRCENWWFREDGEALTYRNVIVDSREWTQREAR